MASDDPLFRDRTPAAAAQQLAIVLAEAAEHLLVLREQLQGRRVASYVLIGLDARIDSIVFHCADLGVRPQGLLGARCVRLADRLETMKPAEGA